MNRRSTVRLPVAVVITVIGAMAALMTGRPEAALFAAPWTVLLVFGLSSAHRQRVKASVALETERVLAGDEANVDVTVLAETDGWIEVDPRPDPGFWRNGSPSDRSTAVVDVVDAGRPLTIRCSLQAEEWGAHDLGRVALTFNEPYGLIQWSGMMTDRRPIRVHPQPTELHSLLSPWLVRRLAGSHDSSAVERGIEFADIRRYGPGDSLRDINWRASARSDEIWVSQRHPDRATDVVLFLDSLVEAGHDVRSAVGLAIEAAVALAENHLAMIDRVGLVEMGGVVRWVAPGTGRLQLQRLTDTLLSTQLYANAADRDLDFVPPRALPPRSFIVALTPLFDDRFVDALFVLRGAGHDVAVLECDATTEQDLNPVGRPPTDVSRVARRLWDAERTVVRDRLGQRGIAIGRWHRGQSLDPVLAEVMARRTRTRGAFR